MTEDTHHNDQAMNFEPRHTFSSALRWAYVATIGQRSITTILTFVLAALLGPRDFGLVAMAMAYIIFLEMFVGQGMGASIIQRKNLQSQQLSSIFWFIMVVALVLTACGVGLGKLWASIYNEPQLTAVIGVLSASIILKGLTVVPHALLQRRMEFRKLAIVNGGSSLIAGAVGVVLALNEFGVWALVAQQLLSAALSCVGFWLASGWAPRLTFKRKHVGERVGFSSGVVASQLGVFVAGQSDAILMGIFFGPLAVGLYRLAERMMDIVLEMATRSIQIVALPHFASSQQDPVALRNAVYTCIRLSATLTIPAMAILAIAAGDVMAMLGSEWLPAASVVHVLVFMGMGKAVTLFSGPLLLACGRSRTSAVLVWSTAICTALAIAAVGFSMRNAPLETAVTSVAVARTAVYALIYGIATICVMLACCRLPVSAMVSAVIPGGAGAFAAVAMTGLTEITPAIAGAPTLFRLVTQVMLAAGAAGGAILLIDRSARVHAVALARAMMRFVGSRTALTRANSQSEATSS